MDYLSGFGLAIGIIALAVVAWRLCRSSKKPAEPPLTVEEYVQRIQSYGRSPEPKPRPLKTVEVRDGEIPF